MVTTSTNSVTAETSARGSATSAPPIAAARDWTASNTAPLSRRSCRSIQASARARSAGAFSTSARACSTNGGTMTRPMAPKTRSTRR